MMADITPTLAPEWVGEIQLPTARRTLIRLLRGWIIGIVVFGYGPAFTYGQVAWLFNELQWRWTYLLYLTEVPLVGGVLMILLPLVWYQPIHRALIRWSAGQPVDRQECLRVYERALRLPWRVALSAFGSALVGYVLGIVILHQRAEQPMAEIAKTFPAIPLVGGMMGAYCYFATGRALHSVVAWCSVQMRRARPIQHVSLAEKFLATTVVLTIAMLCLLQPAAYTLGQIVTEQHLTQRTLERLRGTAHRMQLMVRPEDRLALLPQAALGSHGYAFVVDRTGRMTSAHPSGYTRLAQERFYRVEEHLDHPEGVWMDRVGAHRVVAFVRSPESGQAFFSISFPADFSQPLHAFMGFSWVIVLEVLFVVFLFGRYYTRGITIPLRELTHAAQHIAEHGDLSHAVPVTTNDELSELARAFNRMIERLQSSKADLEEYTRRLERSAQQLSATNQDMEDLLRVVSHDLRAPLINIQGFSKRLAPLMQQTVQTLEEAATHSASNGVRSQLEQLKGDIETRFAESLQFISKGVEKMDTLLSSLLAISRVGRKADPVQLHDLDGIVEEALATFTHQLKEHAIQVIRHPLPKAVPCRRNEINQVFSNLLSNAINYMGAAERRFVEIGGTETAEHAECFVRDTGVGIAPEDHERVFQMFTRLQTVDVPGEGVGLAYVKKIIRSHGGTIWVSSRRREGSTFTFTLPRQPAVMKEDTA